MTQTDKNNLANKLTGFTGTTAYYKQPLFGESIVYTDGAKALFTEGKCWWLHDKIASLQSLPAIRDDVMLQGMQFWVLKVDVDKHTAVLTCERDSNNVAYSETITYTDFPLPSARIWVAPGFVDGTTKMVMMLPSEY